MEPKISKAIREIYRITGELEQAYHRPFTPDGHLIGSIGEVYASEYYDLELLPPGAQLYDAATSDGRKVQIKLTQTGRVSLSAEAAPDYLLVLKLDKCGVFTEIYNGPGKLPFDFASRASKTAQRSIGLNRLSVLARGVAPEDRIPPRITGS